MQPETGETEDTEQPYRLEKQVGYLMRLANQRHTAIFLEIAPHDLTPTQFSALVRLAELGECSQNELGRRTAMDAATIKGVIDRLRSKKFIEVAPAPHDKRRSIITIAPGHAGIESELHAAGHAITRATLAPLTAEEAAVFLGLLEKLKGP